MSAQVLSGVAVGLYRGQWRFGSFDEVAALAFSASATTALLFAIDALVIHPRMIPAGAVLAGGFLALVAMAAARYLWRLRLEYRQRPHDDGRARLLVFGAGDGGAQVLTALLRDPDSPYMPVGLLDDDRSKRNRRMLGIQVLGDRHRLAAAAAETQADTLLIAIPKAGADIVSDLYDLATEAGLRVKVLPPVAELYRDQVGVGDIRDVTEEDLLGRRPVLTDVASIAGYLTGKRVLVTGAGGSIGSELCRQIYCYAPAELIMLDRDESALHGVQLSIHGKAVMDSPALVLADIRDQDAIEAIFDVRRPQVVFHAAALKHLSLLSVIRPRRSNPTFGERSMYSRRPGRPESRDSSTSPPTRQPTRPASSAIPSISPSGSPLRWLSTRPASSSVSALAMSWVAAARCWSRSVPRCRQAVP